MTEEEIKELAKEYIDSCTKRAGFVILTENIKSDFIDLFVAGFMKCLELKADKPKWHKVAEGDYPPCEKGYYTVNVLTNYGDINFGDFNNGQELADYLIKGV